MAHLPAQFPVSGFLMLTLINQRQIMAYYLLTVLEQDDGVEVQRLVKDLVRSRVSIWFDCLRALPFLEHFGTSMLVCVFCSEWAQTVVRKGRRLNPGVFRTENIKLTNPHKRVIDCCCDVLRYLFRILASSPKRSVKKRSGYDKN